MKSCISPGHIVLDANIFVKLLNPEEDSIQAIEFLTDCIDNNCFMIAPTLFEYEVISVCACANVPSKDVLTLLEKFKACHLFLKEPKNYDWDLALEIYQDGSDKNGHPSIYDSIYHAMAINQGIHFVTADSRYFAKAKKHGYIHLLKNWQSLFGR